MRIARSSDQRDLGETSLGEEQAGQALTEHRRGLHQVDGKPCHHLAFEQEVVDWQIWIDAGTPLPRRLTITYKLESGEPQYTVTLRRWITDLELDDVKFEFTPPAGATRMKPEEAKADLPMAKASKEVTP